MSKTCIICGKEIEKCKQIAKKIPLLNIIPIEWVDTKWLKKRYEIFRQYAEYE